MSEKKKSGRPSFQPTDEQRKTVRAMIAYGVPQEDVADVIGVDAKTLRKHFDQEIKTAATEANAKVAQALYNQAVNGNVGAACFWMKTRAGWRETHQLDIKANHEHRYITDEPMDGEAWEGQYAVGEQSKATH